jgi:pyrrolidone-carboxylate peptidase
MRILLTGFEPFDGDDINSSQETVKAVACDEKRIIININLI